MSDGGGVQECIHSELLKEYVYGRVRDSKLQSLIAEHLEICEFCDVEAATISYEATLVEGIDRSMEKS